MKPGIESILKLKFGDMPAEEERETAIAVLQEAAIEACKLPPKRFLSVSIFTDAFEGILFLQFPLMPA